MTGKPYMEYKPDDSSVYFGWRGGAYIDVFDCGRDLPSDVLSMYAYMEHIFGTITTQQFDQDAADAMRSLVAEPSA